MNPALKNVLAVAAGIIAGGILNMFIINMSSSIIPPPADADITTMEGLKNTMHLFEPKHFIMPFLAHALGSLLGAYIAVRLAARNHLMMAVVVGSFFLIGGIANVMMLPSPLWYSILDIVVAYLPMAYLGYLLGRPVMHKLQG